MNNTPKPSPKSYDVPYENWRPGQFETVEWVLDNEGFLLLNAPTGSGKTAIAKAVSVESPTTALVKTKSLQQANYADELNFDELFGKGNYDCVHPDHIGVKANKCAYSDEGMHKCPVSDRCPYLLKKNRVMFSDKRSLNYAYWLSARWPRQRVTETVFMDEAHQLPEITLDWAGTQVGEKTRTKWGLPEFPTINGNQQSVSVFFKSKDPTGMAYDWLAESIATLKREEKRLEGKTSDKEIKRARECESFIWKLEATRDALGNTPDDWFVKSGQGAIKEYSDGGTLPAPGFICKPLSPRFHFPIYFDHALRSVLMSATLGNPSVLAEELGIDNFLYRKVENQWPPETRPVQILDTPRMGHKSKSHDYAKQAEAISDAILSMPRSWSGVIHVTRKTESKYLAKRLAKNGLAGRLWTPDFKDGTNIQMAKWRQHKRKSGRVGQIAITWAWWEGVDLRDERICIVAKVPFPPLGDEYNMARLKYSNSSYLWRAATGLEQALGRTRRGEEEDYDTNGHRNQLVAIADGNWTRVRKYMSDSVREALVE